MLFLCNIQLWLNQLFLFLRRFLLIPVCVFTDNCVFEFFSGCGSCLSLRYFHVISCSFRSLCVLSVNLMYCNRGWGGGGRWEHAVP